MKALQLARIAAFPLLATTALHAQGPLDPPGPPAPSMKTAEQIEPRTPIESLPFTISQSGSYYLTKSLTSAGAGITIASDNVSLDLNGFALTGTTTNPSSVRGIEIAGASAAPRSNVTVENGSIQGFGTSVQVNFGTGCTIRKLTCNASGFTSVYANGCQATTISDCSMIGAGSHGLRIVGGPAPSSGNQIRNCSVLGAQGNGIRLESTTGGTCTGNRVSNCTVVDSATSGILITADGGSTTGNEIEGSTASQSGSHGIAITAKNGSLTRGNSVRNCVVAGAGADGIYVSGVVSSECSGNTISSNRVHGATQYGIFLDVSSDNRVDGNHAAGTIRVGVDGTSGVRSRGPDNIIVKNTARGHTRDIFPDESDIAALNNYEGAQERREAISSLPATILSPGSYYLTKNLVSSGDGIDISGDHITLDLNGFSISGSDTPGSYGIKIDDTFFTEPENVAHGVTVRNGSIRGFDRGVELTKASGCILTDLRINEPSGTGIYLSESQNCIIEKSTIVEAGSIGIHLAISSTGNRVVSCAISGSAEAGSLSGIRITDGSKGNVVSHCTFNSCGQSIDLFGGVSSRLIGNVISDNSIRNCFLGIRLLQCEGNRIEGNHVSEVSGGGSVGILSGTGCSGNLFLKNSVSNAVDCYSLSATDAAGPEVSTTGALSSTGDSSHPWANFSHNEGP